jgi:hypothetical protein
MKIYVGSLPTSGRPLTLKTKTIYRGNIIFLIFLQPFIVLGYKLNIEFQTTANRRCRTNASSGNVQNTTLQIILLLTTREDSVAGITDNRSLITDY